MNTQPEFDVLGFGTMAVDEFLYVSRYPEADGKERVIRERRRFGGLVATALAAASRLGACCAYGAVLGDDELSDNCRAAFAGAGIRPDFLLREPGAGPVRSVIVTEEERRTRTVFFNAERQRSYPVNRIGPDLLSRTRVLLIDHSGIEFMLALSKAAASAGVPVIADIESKDQEDVAELVISVSHLILPLGFARKISGREDPVRAVQAIHRAAPRACTAVTCGSGGCHFAVGESSMDVHHMAAFPVRTAETTGCGDVFHGAYAAALARGRAVPECIRFASAAAGFYASRPSGWEHLPGPEDLELLLAGTGIHPPRLPEYTNVKGEEQV